jgi:hypothetical protein
MHHSKPLLALALVIAAVAAFGASASSARPQVSIPTPKTCKPFVGGKWANPYPPHEVGDHYQVTVTGSVFTCSSAGKYVRKFIAEKIKPSPKLPGIGYVSGGPAGYVCTSGVGFTHTAYQGGCRAKKQTLTSSSFTWGPYKDS